MKSILEEVENVISIDWWLIDADTRAEIRLKITETGKTWEYIESLKDEINVI